MVKGFLCQGESAHLILNPYRSLQSDNEKNTSVFDFRLPVDNNRQTDNLDNIHYFEASQIKTEGSRQRWGRSAVRVRDGGLNGQKKHWQPRHLEARREHAHLHGAHL